MVLAIAAVGCLGVATIYPPFRSVWLFDHLEQNARKVVTGSELQAWATNLLARRPEDGPVMTLSELGTDFPRQLLRLAPRTGPSVMVHRWKTSDTNNYPPWVRLYWGSGFLGATGFDIGPTNFVSPEPRARCWQPGVYFYRKG
jgi:hypothetical protein